MFNSEINIDKYLGWFERIIDIIMKLLGMGGSKETTVAETTTTVAETTTVADV